MYLSFTVLPSRKGRIHDPTIVQFLFEVSQSLHDGMDHSNMKYDDSQQPARLVSRFVTMVTQFGSHISVFHKV